MQTSVRSRLPWLALNIFLDVIAVSVIAYYEATIQDVIALAVILPIISDMGGNVGIQTVSIAVRGLASGEISFPDFRKILAREFGVGVLNGLVLGLLLGVVGYIWKGNIVLGVVAGLALWINTIVAGIAGAAIPLLLKKRNLDPATGSGALLTTITDISGFFLTLSLATYLIPYLK
jgi:magnesium transporter